LPFGGSNSKNTVRHEQRLESKKSATSSRACLCRERRAFRAAFLDTCQALRIDRYHSGAAVGLIIGNVIIANIYFKKHVGINLKLLFSRLFSGAPMVVLCAVLAGFVANYIPGISVKILLLQCLGFTFVYGLALYISG